ncbi:unnamed protein product [Miscanthus lutarioriparius]|uniref:DUF4220 domain-containing protein n=1 Tax=Miscanthus lutarioriparius TaxID=422564 RepID=A0A811NJE1_9POAL|nr:unnamed protein product [Miscanthus lutarioriparius]
MESFGQLINEWEIQSLVLLSFVLQVFLFFTGSLRRCSRNAVLRVTIWVAYLGADVVAIYALGSLSRQKDANMDNNNNGSLRRNHPLAFLWAPFLLIHLGGQDTITAFSLEDNKLWLRHMLNMLAQVSLALYVFWKSGIWHSVWLLLVAIFLFIPGIIKYAERTLALMYGNVDNAFVREPSSRSRWWIPSKDAEDDGYEGYICFALRWAPGTKDMFAGRTIGWAGEGNYKKLTHYRLDPNQFFKLFDVEFCIMYSDLYTKTRLLRTTTGVVLRFISLVSTILALVFFTVSSSSSKAGGYGGTVVADIVITYTLLYGGFLLEVCAAETRPLWSNTMGQYTFLSYLGCDEPGTSLSLSQRVMSKIRKMARCLGVGEAKKLFWVSKLLDSKQEAVDDNIRASLVQELHRIRSGRPRRQWRRLGLFVTQAAPELALDLIYFIGTLHLITEVCLNNRAATASAAASGTAGGDDDDDADDLDDTCRKLSNYMLYLVVAHSASASLLQVATGSPEDALELLRQKFLPSMSSGGSGSKDAILRQVSDKLRERRIFMGLSAERRKETLEELRDMWVRLLLYTAGKSRPAEHAAQLARGGELLTFVWLLMLRHEIGDCALHRMELAPRQADGRGGYFKVIYVADPHEVSPEHEIDDRNTLCV